MYETVVLVIPKLLAAFFLMMVYIHLSGKGSLAPISTIDQVGNMALGAMIGGMLYNTDVGILEMTIVVSFWAGLMLLVRYVTNRHMQVKTAVDGEAVCLMQDGKLQTENFNKAGLAVRDFNMLLHQRGFRNLEELRNVWYEYNGQLTVVAKGDEATATVLIENGEINERNLERTGFDLEWLNDKLRENNVELKDVFCAEWHHARLWLYPYDEEVLKKHHAEKA